MYTYQTVRALQPSMLNVIAHRVRRQAVQPKLIQAQIRPSFWESFAFQVVGCVKVCRHAPLHISGEFDIALEALTISYHLPLHQLDITRDIPGLPELLSGQVAPPGAALVKAVITPRNPMARCPKNRWVDVDWVVILYNHIIYIYIYTWYTAWFIVFFLQAFVGHWNAITCTCSGCASWYWFLQR